MELISNIGFTNHVATENIIRLANNDQ